MKDQCGSRNLHTLLHGAFLSLYNEEVHAISAMTPTVLLSVVKVKLSFELRSVTTWALLDNGATYSLIREDIADLLGLTGPTEGVRFRTIHGEDPLLKSRKVSFNVAPYDEDTYLRVPDARTVPRLDVSHHPALCWSEASRRWGHLADLLWHVAERS